MACGVRPSMLCFPIDDRRGLSDGLTVRACTVAEQSRQALSLTETGQAIYVEPQAVSPVPDGRVLVVGEPTYVWSKSRGNGAWVSLTDSLFGVVLKPGMPAIVIAPPPGVSSYADVRALSNGREWDVVFSELAAGPRHPDPPPVVRLWHGVVDQFGWHALETLPPAGPGRIQSSATSELVRIGDELSFAVPVLRDPSSSNVIVFRGRTGSWQRDSVHAASVAYTSVAPGLNGTLRSAVVRAATAVGSDNNSLFLYDRPPSWNVFHRLVKGSTSPVHRPHLDRWGDQLVAGWISPVSTQGSTRWEARAFVGRDSAAEVQSIAIHSSVSELSQVVLSDLGPIWIAAHVSLSPPTFQLRMYQRDSSGVEMIGATANPFEGPVIAARISVTDFLLGRPHRRSHRAGRSKSLIVRYHLDCTRAPTD